MCHFLEIEVLWYWQLGRPVLDDKLVIPYLKYFHFDDLAILQGLYKCFYLMH